jgi:membrane-bound lytic murein transglycosylase MltF
VSIFSKTASLFLPLFLLCVPHLSAREANGLSALQPANQPFTDDLPAMQQRTAIRVLVNHNRTNFFLHDGRHQGFEFELMEQYRKHLNQEKKNNQIATSFIYIPLPFEQLLPALIEGRGDVVAAGMTITPQRRQLVDFTAPYLPNVQEILVASDKAKPVDKLEDLAGQRVHLLRGSSYVDHLRALNQHFKQAHIEPIKLVEVDSHLQTEDLLEMLSAKVIDYTFADDHIATIWAKLLPNLVLHRTLQIHSGGKIAWAVRKENPKLRASLNDFIGKIKKGTLLGNMLFQRYYRNTRWIKNPLQPGEQDKLMRVRGLMEKYATQYHFDWLTIAAQAYQESGLEQSKRNPSGALGIMQIRPTTAADTMVAITSIDQLENNIHAGVKYLAWIRDRYFSDAEILPQDRLFFSLAAYNAGPAKVRRMRDKAKAMGLDPNRWFGNVEQAALHLVGQETVRYVRNILKYYTAYRLAFDLQDASQAAIKEQTSVK